MNHAPTSRGGRDATSSRERCRCAVYHVPNHSKQLPAYIFSYFQSREGYEKTINCTYIIIYGVIQSVCTELWRIVETSRRSTGKRLAQDTISCFKKIVSKAQKEKSYGNLLAAELLTSSLQTQISPDSVDTEKARLKELCDKTEKTDKVLHAVYCCALGKLFDRDDAEDNSSTILLR